MKIFVASDIHGSETFGKKMLERFEAEGTERMLLLGDLLYHGPRNDLPEGYAPKAMIDMLNAYKDRIYCVRGNCDAEVDQMVLTFPVMADYCIIPVGKRVIYATHGHIYNENHLPPMMEGDVLLHGHTHLLTAQKKDTYYLLNPGSVSIPKGGNPHSYAILEDTVFTIKDLEGNVITEIDLA